MPKIVPIVEGAGEVNAVPVLCTKLMHERQRYDIFIEAPVDAKGRSNLTKQNGLERLINIAWSKPDCVAVLLLVDADEDCPKELARSFHQRVLALGNPRCPVVIVVAKMEYEAWFLASLETLVGEPLQGRPGLLATTQYSGDVEARKGVKEWLSAHYPKGFIYSERLDQAAMTRLIDTTLARERSRSFRRLCHAIDQILDAIDNNKILVTPEAV